MNSQEFVESVQKNIKLIRIEYDLSQEKMASALGISKKTLVEIEKGRVNIGWTLAVACATIFAGSSILQNEFGGSAADFIPNIALGEQHVFPKTLGGKVWWREILSENGFVIQQNIISLHFRLLNKYNEKIISSFSLDEVKNAFEKIKENS
jgi:DNA-binding XRE family transcriptional regulator